MTTKTARIYQHVLRKLADGRWVCKGGPHTGPRCAFATPEYHEAVTHATVNGATPPDAPREVWA